MRKSTLLFKAGPLTCRLMIVLAISLASFSRSAFATAFRPAAGTIFRSAAETMPWRPVLTTGRPVQTTDPDLPFRQATSVQYPLPADLQGAALKKVLTDYNGNAYVLTDKGLYYVSQGRLVPDQRFRAQSKLVPLDVVAQEGSGYLYYLYEDKYLTNGYAGVPYGLLPKGKYSSMAVAADGSMLLIGKEQWGLVKAGTAENGKTENGKAGSGKAGSGKTGSAETGNGAAVIPIQPVAEEVISLQVNQGAFYVLSAKGVYRLDNGSFHLLHQGVGLQSMAFLDDIILLGTQNGYYGIRMRAGGGADTAIALQSRLPVPDVTRLLVVSGHIWAGTALGAFMRENSGSFRYYASRRWLLDDKVLQMTADGHGNIYLLTEKGLNRISFPRETLAQKAALFERTIRERKIRYGMISQVGLQVPGDLSTSVLVDTDNDGLWSSFYLGSQALEYAVTAAEPARRYAWETFEAFERLLSVNPLKGFPSRTFERKGCAVSDPVAWRASSDPEWEWKGTTSSDEFVGYIFVAAMMDQMVAKTDAEHARVASFIDKILTHIIDHGYNLVDVDGKHTLWGRWSPDYINWYPESVFDRRLGSTTIIAGLQLAYSLTGKQRYKEEAYRLMNKFGYLNNILIPCGNIKKTPGYIYDGHDMSDGSWNHSDDEMAFLTYWVLYRYAFSDTLRKDYVRAIRDHWTFELPERNALWNLITYATAGEYDRQSIFWHLREYPLDLVEWNIRNSHRKDLDFLPPNLRHQYTKELLPPGEQPMHRHNTNFFGLDGGSGGRNELEGDEYLLPYWMGRYLGVIGTAPDVVSGGAESSIGPMGSADVENAANTDGAADGADTKGAEAGPSNGGDVTGRGDVRDIVDDFYGHPERVLVTAHRADHMKYPENSLSAIRAAIKAGIDIVELDVRETKDSVLVLMHDRKIDRTTNGKGPVSSYTYQELQQFRLMQNGKPAERIPTFDEALQIAKGRIMIDIDFKEDSDRAARETYRLIAGHRMQEQVLFFIYDYKDAARFSRFDSRVPIMPRAYNPHDVEAVLARGGFPVVHGDEDYYSDSLMLSIRRSGMRVWMNALGKYDSMERAVPSAGFDAVLQLRQANVIQTDLPEQLLAYLRKKGLHR